MNKISPYSSSDSDGLVSLLVVFGPFCCLTVDCQLIYAEFQRAIPKTSMKQHRYTLEWSPSLADLYN